MTPAELQAEAEKHGYVLVPKEPTFGMLQAFRLCCDYHTTWLAAWEAVLAAAPKPGDAE